MIVGSGIDVIEVERIARALQRRGERFARRVFTRGEIAECRSARRPATHFAARFAVKEATMKAVGTGWAHGVRWVDIETRAAGRSLLDLELHGKARRHARALGADRQHVGVAWSRRHAFAVVLLEAHGAR